MSRKTIWLDSMPPAKRDEKIMYAGFHETTAFCRMRLYEDALGQATIVLTDTDPDGTSITNAAKTAFCTAWRACGEPLPCAFVEHYRGECSYSGRPPDPDDSEAEHWTRVTFDSSPDNYRPAMTETHVTGRTIYGINDVRATVSPDLAFRNADWRHMTPEMVALEINAQLLLNPERQEE